MRSLDRGDLYIVCHRLAGQGFALLTQRGQLNPSDENSFGNLEGYVRHELEHGVREYRKHRPFTATLVPVGDPTSQGVEKGSKEFDENIWENEAHPPSMREHENPNIGGPLNLTVEQLLARIEAEQVMYGVSEDDYRTLEGYYRAGNYRAMAAMLGLSTETLHRHIESARINAIRLITWDGSPSGPWEGGRGQEWEAHCQEMSAMFGRVRAERERLGTLKPMDEQEVTT